MSEKNETWFMRMVIAAGALLLANLALSTFNATRENGGALSTKVAVHGQQIDELSRGYDRIEKKLDSALTLLRSGSK